MTAIHAGRMFDGELFHENVSISIDGRRIAPVSRSGRLETLPEDWLLAPGFVDLQVNGGGGVLFNEVTTLEGAAAIARAHARAGTTSLLPTLISDGDRIEAALDATGSAIRAGVPGVIGVHIEGPFINPARRGIHPESRIVPIDDGYVELLSQPHPGVRLVTLAPENVSASRLAQLARGNTRVFAGHSDATFEQAMAACSSGVLGFTHLYNAMSQFGSRAPGCVGAAFAHEGAGASIIVDGLHAHPASVRVAWGMLGAARLFLVSDAMPTSASDTTSFVWENEEISLCRGRLARADGTLAGAHLTMAGAVANAVRLCAIPLGDALRMATSTPAMFAGAEDVGRIRPGSRADLVALDTSLRVRAVWQAGERVV